MSHHYSFAVAHIRIPESQGSDINAVISAMLAGNCQNSWLLLFFFLFPSVLSHKLHTQLGSCVSSLSSIPSIEGCFCDTVIQPEIHVWPLPLAPEIAFFTLWNRDAKRGFCCNICSLISVPNAEFLRALWLTSQMKKTPDTDLLNARDSPGVDPNEATLGELPCGPEWGWWPEESAKPHRTDLPAPRLHLPEQRGTGDGSNDVIGRAHTIRPPQKLREDRVQGASRILTIRRCPGWREAFPGRTWKPPAPSHVPGLGLSSIHTLPCRTNGSTSLFP